MPVTRHLRGSNSLVVTVVVIATSVFICHRNSHQVPSTAIRKTQNTLNEIWVSFFFSIFSLGRHQLQQLKLILPPPDKRDWAWTQRMRQKGDTASWLSNLDSCTLTLQFRGLYSWCQHGWQANRITCDNSAMEFSLRVTCVRQICAGLFSRGNFFLSSVVFVCLIDSRQSRVLTIFPAALHCLFPHRETREKVSLPKSLQWGYFGLNVRRKKPKKQRIRKVLSELQTSGKQ